MRTLGGLSLIGRSILSAKQASEIQEVFVSSNSDEILDHANKMGAIPIKRPEQYSTDEASSESVVLHFLESQKLQLSDIDNVLMIQATSPFLDPESLNKAANLLSSKTFDSVFSAAKRHVFLWSANSNLASPINHKINFRQRRQDIPDEFIENGAFYGFSKIGFLKHQSRFFGRIGIVEVSKNDAFDIDDEDDLNVVQAMFASGLGSNPRLEFRPAVIFCDFDGVLTDNTFWIDGEGAEFVRLNRSDGLAIKDITREGCPVVIVSGDDGSHIEARALKLGIQSILGVKDKKKAVLQWCEKHKIAPEQAVFIGNDENDIEAMGHVGLRISPADASANLRSGAHLVLTRDDSYGIMRKVHDYFFKG